MRHRASRSPANLLRRLPRAAARPVGALAALSPVRALLALAVALGFGTGTFVAVASVGSGAFTESGEAVTVAGRQAETTSRDGGRVGLPASGSASGADSDAAGDPGATTPPSGGALHPEVPSKGEKGKGGATSTTDPSEAASPTPEATAPTTSPSSPDEGTTPDDDTSPDTSLSERSSDDGEAVFAMSASEDASFTCSLDGGAFEPCDSPASYSDLEPGWHTLAVRATDSAGNVDPTPAEIRWHVNGAPSSRG